jgi:[ribosomal protein S18]-alanine N-acetyltransferase
VGQVFEAEVRRAEPSRQLSYLRLEAVPQIIQIARHSFDVVWSAEEFSFFLSHDSRFAYGFWIGDQLVAYLIGLIVQGELDIASVATLPEFRRQGLAADLLCRSFALDEVRRVFLEVAVDNHTALSLYQKLGFQIQGIRKRYYAGKTDAVVMSWNKKG